MTHSPVSPVPASIPVLVTDRLRLRAHVASDLAACAAMWADPEVVRHIGGKPFSPSESWQKMLRYLGLWSLCGFGYWAVEEKSSGQYLGDVGLACFKREIASAFKHLPELGWALIPAAHGKGYATEAARAALEWHDRRFDSGSVFCLITPDNQASLRVAEKCGFAEREQLEYMGAPTKVLVRSERQEP